MATHNYIRLLGIVNHTPQIMEYKKGGRLAMFSMIVITKSRTDKERYFYNVPTVITDDEAMIEDICGYSKYDIVELTGVITTKNVRKMSVCTHCGAKNAKEQAMIFVVTPLYLCHRAGGLESEEEALQMLRPHAEVSNYCIAIGTLLRDPELIMIGKKKNNTVRYPISIKRKYYINDSPGIHSDYPWINVTGTHAESDMCFLHKDSVILVEGYIQTRKATQTSVCRECEKTYDWQDTAVEIIGHSVEYLNNFYSTEEVQDFHSFDSIQVEIEQ